MHSSKLGVDYQKMKIKRERLQIIQDILKVIQGRNGKIKPTHIMYKANLSHQMLDEYLKYLVSTEFIKESESGKGKTYALTQKGFDYINKYELIVRFVESFGLN